MSTHPKIDRICAAAILLSLLFTVLFVNGEALGLQPASKAQGYETRLFDTGRVHTIDIVMDGWEEFLESCENEEYAACSVVIDNEAYKNVGLRAKGNTSLSMVSAMDSDRYSFKIEFDQYESGKTYYGLDKLCLNNIIQDNTCMKDYLTYQMMGAFGVDAPLCSYVYITVNGQDWGLYLAVEGVEDGFLQRNYGSGHGNLYKPDSLSFGGGRGNGRDFDMGGFMEARNGGEPAGTETGRPVSVVEPPDNLHNPNAAAGADGAEPFMAGSMRSGGMGSADVKLQYTDNDPESYSNIFDSAKTEVTPAAQSRLIQALKALSEGTAIENAVDIDRVLRYFVVHNYVVNGDSYTGSMVHNYYLYEDEGRLSMIPWDYNLAFGTFQSASASSAVNDPIDTPLSVTGGGDRPMIDWIFGSEEYTRLYHQYFSEFLADVDPTAVIEETFGLIAPYVERDPTGFCTYEEFETGVEALKTFCALRSESISGQLAETIPTTRNGQSADSASLVDASGLTLSDMGTMTHGGGPGGGGGAPGEPQENRLPSQPPENMDTDGFSESRGGRENGFSPGGSGPSGGQPPGGPDSRLPVPDGQTLLLLGASALILLAGILMAFFYRRRGRS